MRNVLIFRQSHRIRAIQVPSKSSVQSQPVSGQKHRNVPPDGNASFKTRLISGTGFAVDGRDIHFPAAH